MKKTKRLAGFTFAVLCAAIFVSFGCGDGGNGEEDVFARNDDYDDGIANLNETAENSDEPTAVPTSTPTTTSTPEEEGYCGDGACLEGEDNSNCPADCTGIQPLSPPSAPAVPTGVGATPGNGKNIIDWNVVNGAASYNIYWSILAYFNKATGTKIANATKPYTHGGLTSGVTYYYIVTAVSAVGESAESVIVSGKPPFSPAHDTTPPSVPTNLTATVISSHQTDLSWGASTDNVGTAGYKVYKGGVFLKSVATTTASDAGLMSFTQYCYKISAYDAAGNESKQSSQICQMTYLTWDTSTVDSTGYVGAYSSIAIDSNDNVRISYYNSTNGKLKYATDAFDEWVVSTVDNAGNVGAYSSIAIDSNDNVHISYYNSTNYDLKYATNAFGVWVTSTLDGAGNVGAYTSIAIDSNNDVHISYYDSTNYDLKYATNTSGAWITSTVDGTGYVGAYSSIAIDSNDDVHISYYDSINYNLKYATNTSGAWVISTVDSTGNVGKDSSIAIDSNNGVHIIYYDYTKGDLKYVTNASGAWVTSTLDSTDYVGQDSSIAIDSSDDAHISYYDSTNGRLKYATNTSGAWVTFIVDSTDNVGEYSSIAIDSDDDVHISYFDNTNYDLKYAHSK